MTTMMTAGAGSGKTYQICEEIIDHFTHNHEWEPANLIVTTFTEKAAYELKERVTARLMKAGDFRRVTGLSEAYVGTVHSICLRFLRKYGYLIGLSPALGVLPEGEDLEMISELLDKHDISSLHELEVRLTQIDSQTKVNAYPDLIKKIAELARINGLAAEELRSSRDNSITSYLAILGPTIIFDRKRFTDLLEDQFRYFDPIKDKLKDKNKDFYEAVKEILEAYRSDNEKYVPWHKYLKLTTELNKEYQSQVAPLQQFVGTHHRWPAFQKDISDYIKGIFDAAIGILDEFQTVKQDLGVIDFADMEVKMLELLGNEHFIKEFSAQIKLILVDEFQDTSPLQLEIFNKWAEYAGESIWVGDIKQSIYGFRGADAALVDSVIKSLPEENLKPLGTSYRSRKELVEAANKLFAKVFQPMEEKYIRLKPRNDIHGGHGMKGNAIYSLKVDKDLFEDNLAGCIDEILHEGWIVFDKESKEYRKIRPSDICILIRGNDDVTTMRRALAKKGIPLGRKGAMFTELPEVYFLTAILRYLVDQTDEYAIAQILYFASRKPDAGKLINHRIRYLLNQREQENQKAYGNDSAFLHELDELRSLTNHIGISQLIEILFNRTGFQAITGKWGSPDSVRETINRLTGLAANYSGTCTRLNRIESIYGFIRYIEDNTSERSRDELAGDGVSVMTYHGAKGLEWPVVFLASLDNAARGGVFNPMVITEPGARLFEGRSIRYWPFPYHNNVKKSHINLLFSDAENEVVKINREEEKRLLYVGFTRARDYLFLVSSADRLNWFEEAGGKEWQAGLNIQLLEFADGEEREEEKTIKVVRKIRSVEKMSAEHYFLAPSREPMDVVATLSDPVRLGAYRPLSAKVNEDEETMLGELFHQYFATGLNAASLIESHRLGHLISEAYLEESLKRFRSWVESNYPDAIWHAEWPVTYFHDGQMIQGFADLVLELPDRLILIDHKSYPGGCDTLHNRINEEKYPGQLAWYEKALNATETKKVSEVFLHFPVSSSLVRIQYANN